MRNTPIEKLTNRELKREQIYMATRIIAMRDNPRPWTGLRKRVAARYLKRYYATIRALDKKSGI